MQSIQKGTIMKLGPSLAWEIIREEEPKEANFKLNPNSIRITT